MLCCRYRSRYVSLVAKRSLAPVSMKKGECALSAAEEALLEEVERALPLCTLILFRQLGVKQALVQSRRQMDTQKIGQQQRQRRRVMGMLDATLKGPSNWLRRLSIPRRDSEGGDESNGARLLGEGDEEGLSSHGQGGEGTRASDDLSTPGDESVDEVRRWEPWREGTSICFVFICMWSFYDYDVCSSKPSWTVC